MIIFGTVFIKKEFTRKTVVIFILSCIASRTFVHYALELRMYSWALFFVTMAEVSAWYFIKTGKKRWWTALLFCLLGAAYTHYWAMVAAGISYFLLLIYTLRYRKDRSIAIILMAITAVILYLPWLPVFIRQFSQVSQDFWVLPLTWGNILDFVFTIFSTGDGIVDRILFLIFCFFLFLFFVRKKKTEKNIFAFGGLCCAFLLILSGIILSVAIRPIFATLYLVPICALVWLFFAIEFGTINNKRLFVFLFFVLFQISVMSLSLSIYKEISDNRMSNAFYTYLDERIKQDDVFLIKVSDDFHIPTVMNYLFPNHSSYMEYTSGIYDDRTVWMFYEGTDEVPPEGEAEFCGFFHWDRYRIRLYRRSPAMTP